MSGRGSHVGGRSETRPVSLSADQWLLVEEIQERTGKIQSHVIAEALRLYHERLERTKGGLNP